MQNRLGIVGLALTMILLVPGLLLPVITVRGTLSPEALAALAPQLLEEGLSDDAVAALRPLINPSLLPLMEMTPGGLRGALVNNLGAQLGEQLKGAAEVEVYHQTRSILGSVRHLYAVGSGTAATLILLFSVGVPVTKAALAAWALSVRTPALRQRVLSFVETITKWSMADVFAVALIITYLAAQAAQGSIVTFHASFGSGFYWFAAYCISSIAVQQGLARWARAQSVVN